MWTRAVFVTCTLQNSSPMGYSAQKGQFYLQWNLEMLLSPFQNCQHPGHKAYQKKLVGFRSTQCFPNSLYQRTFYFNPKHPPVTMGNRIRKYCCEEEKQWIRIESTAVRKNSSDLEEWFSNYNVHQNRPEDLLKQNFWYSKSGVWPKNLHFSQVLSWYWCC